MDTRFIRYFSTFLSLLLGTLLTVKGFAEEPANKRPKVDAHGDPLPPLARLRIGTTRFRHGGEIVALAYAPDGRGIATLGDDGLLKLWDAVSGKARTFFRVPDGMAVAFAEGGKALLWCDVRGHLYRCEAGQRGDDGEGRRQRVQTFDRGSSERIDAVAFARDGSLAALGSSANQVYFWGRKCEIKLRDGIQALVLDGDGKLLAVNNGREGVRLWDVSGKREARGPLRSFGADAIRSLAFAPDGNILAAGDFDNRIRLWEANSGREIHLLEGHQRVAISGKNGVFCLAFSPDGTRLASGAADGTVRVWDVKSGKELARCAGHGGRVRALAFAPDGKTLASAGADNALRLWQPATGRAIGPVKDDGGVVLAMSASPDGRTLAVLRMPGQLSLWDLRAGKELPKTPKLPAPLAAAVFSPKGHTLVCASVAGHLQLWDYDKGEQRGTTRNVQTTIRLLATADDGSTVAWCGNDRRIVLWDVKAGKELQQFRVPGNTIAALHFSVDGATLLVAGSAGVHRFEIEKKSAGRNLSEQVGSVSAEAISPDGRMLATGGQDGAVRLWELATGKQRRALYGDTSLVRAAAFSADGKLLATGSGNGLIRLWDVANGQRIHGFVGHRGGVVAVAFAEGGSTLITASLDGTALVWDLPALLEVGRSRRIDLSARQVQALWSDLSSDDATRAYEAVETLARAPSATVPFVRQHLTAMSALQLARRIKDLDSDEFDIRVQAMRELAVMGKFAEPALRKLLTEKPSLEARRRAKDLLVLLDHPTFMMEHLRALRAVEVLERIGDEPARKVLQSLAEGAAEATLTREAKAALDRLRRQEK
jgi:WD40 repeat protein